MKSIQLLTLAAALLTLSTTSCNDKDFLNVQPRGALSDDQLNTPENAEKQLVAAYSALANDGFTAPFTSLWPYGNLRSGDAYKGGGGIGDIEGFHFYETFTYNRTDVGNTDEVWFRLYVGISRANDALRRLNSLTDAQMGNRQARIAEARFLRGHFYFILKELFDRVPYIDETVPVDQYDQVSNVALSSQALWDKIAADFQAGATSLPATQPEVGRASQVAAKAYLAKVRLFQAYVQNESNHQVTSIDQAKLQDVVRLCDEVIGSGKHRLYTDFGNNFMSAFDNGNEAVFSIQFSKDDGSPRGRINQGNKLNYPMNSEFGCCSFHQPSQNLVNAFKTDANGLPQFATFNTSSLTTPADFQTNAVDPRLDHTVAIPTHPWKYDPSFVFQRSWVRVPDVYGQFMSQKELVGPTDPSFQKLPPFMSSTKNWAVIRYADVLLMKAEALIELGRPSEALPLINQIRQRAQNSTSLLRQANGQPTSNYRIGLYSAGQWNQQYAREALRWERRLEFAMEGSRFFDLVRWGIAADYLNDYFLVEKTRRSYLQNAQFTRGRDEYLPIPLNQINFSKGLYQQNPGW